MKSKLFFLMAPLLLAALFVGGCNILSWTSGDNPETLIDEGRRLMRDADYAGAASAFASAIAEDPLNSDALYLHAKATVHGSGFNALNLADIVSESAFSDGDGLPFTGEDWSLTRASLLYETMGTVYDDLKLIIEGSTHGNFDSADVDLDYGLASGFKGILGFQDTDANGIINDADFPLVIVYGDIGTESEIGNLLEYFNYYVNTAKKTVVGKVTVAENIPQEYIDQFNAYVDNIESWIDDAIAIIAALLEDSELDLTDINVALEEIVEFARNWKIEPNVDNDNDGKNTYGPYIEGVTEEIIDGRDNDGDGWIDEDSNGQIDFDFLP